MRRLHLARPARYIPALRFDWLTPLYDPLLRWVMREERFKRILVAQAGLQTGQRALDLGCGTGTLTIMLKRAYPGADVVGLDGDPRVLEIARRKAAEAGVGIAFDLGMAFDLPYLDNSFDRVVSRAPAALSKGPRGGGRDRDAMVEHVLGAEVAYARKIGIRQREPALADSAAISTLRSAILEGLRTARDGTPVVEKGWPVRYAARRIAWHVLDHAWEIEDRSPQRRG